MKSLDEIPLTREADLEPSFVDLCRSVTAKRARTVIDHILTHGVITSDDLSGEYGYDHPPRAIRDVRETGIPLITYRVDSKTTGRKIGAYTFDNPNKIKHGRIGGRKAFSKQFKDELIARYGARDAFTSEFLESRYLQIDHRIPYQVIGEAEFDGRVEDFMLIDSSSQRKKSWSCENCKNLLELNDPLICRGCFWAFPEDYSHIAMLDERRAELVWRGPDVKFYDDLKKRSRRLRITLQDYIKTLLQK